MQTEIRSSQPDQHPALFSVWQRCVDAKQHSFQQQHILKIRELLTVHHYFEHMQLFHIELNQQIIGFIGIAYRKIEMLYVHPQYAGLGFGSMLLKYALKLGVQEVDVFESNQKEFKFYQKHGFQLSARSKWDAQGYPCATLHLRFHAHS